ncbi:xyloglucanase, partial [Amycolatopsis mediterranei]
MHNVVPETRSPVGFRSARRLLAGALVVLVPAAVAVVAGAPASPAAPAAATTTWRNAEIAGGGFVPGIVFNQTEPGLVYARTDIGGAYRWNTATGRWLPLLDSVGWTDWGHNGVVSLATDPVDPNRVYVAAGMYTNSWDPNPGAILRSA